MPLAGPFVQFDYDAEPTVTTDGEGFTVTTWPALAGLFAITDPAEFDRSADLLAPFRVYPVPAQNVLAGDDPADPQSTVTLHFADAGEAAEIMDAVNALPPIPAPNVGPPAPPPPVLTADMRQVRLKLAGEPFGEGSRLDAVEAFMAAQDRAARIEWEYARELRRDHPLVGIMGLFFGLTSDDLDVWFLEARAIGPTLAA